jgi:phospholipase/carboxylesterase
MPIFVGAGRSDPIVPPAETERLVSLLRGSEADVTLEWVPAGHGLSAGDVDAARRWVHEVLGGTKALGRPRDGSRPRTIGGDIA